MCGTRARAQRAGPGPASRPRPAPPSSLASKRSCIPTQIPSSGRPPPTRSRSASSRPGASPRAALSTWPTPGDHGERRLAHGRRVGRDRPASAPARANAGADASAGCRRRSRRARPSREPLGRADPAVARRDGLPQRLAERLERRLGDVVVVGAGATRRGRVQPACIAKRSSACGSSETARPPTRSPRERERDLGVRRGGRGRPPRSRAPRPSARSPSRSGRCPRASPSACGERVAERGEHVLDRVVLVDVEVAAGDAVEVEAGVEGAEREQVVEEADAGRDARRGPLPSRSSVIRSAVSVLVRVT